MADQLELLKQLRAIGVKMVDFHRDGQSGELSIIAVEFFPRELLDLDSIVPVAGAESMPTDRPPPTEDEQPNVPPAIARILKRGSVS
jgi:hypothetical protein